MTMGVMSLTLEKFEFDASESPVIVEAHSNSTTITFDTKLTYFDDLR